MNQQLIYKDVQAKAVLAEMPAVLEKLGLLFCSADKPVPGLPCLSKPESRWDDARGRSVTLSPWGEAQAIYDGYTLGTYDLHSVLPLYRLFDLPPDAPKARVPEHGHAVIDVLTGVATVYAQNGGFEPEAVYTTRVSDLERQAGKEALRQIRADLALAGVPVYPGELYGESSIPYPWDDEGDFSAPSVHNDEVSVPLVGYVLDPDSQEVVYLHVVGAKTALRSIWGTLSNGGVQMVSLAADRHITGYTSHNYETFSSSVEEDTHLHRLVITDRQAIAPDVAERAYLVIPKEGTDDLDRGEVFAARLNALLPIPILPHWGTTLRQYGSRRELLQPCLCGGDVEQAYRITKDGWVELVADLVQDGELSI